MLRRIEPSFRERVWGVTNLEPWFPNQHQRIGEVWFEQSELPLLIKFLFTSANLSVQVHPNDEQAREFNSFGKTEMWHILAAEPTAERRPKIAAGFREPISPERLRESAVSGEIEQLLEWHDAAPGDTFFIPAGTVHAIGAGITLCEIQQNSDITYRLYDYGRGRELHLDQGVNVSHRGPSAARVRPKGDVLVDCDYFRVQRGGSDSSGLRLLIVIGGTGEINGESAKAGEVWMADEALKLHGQLKLLTASAGLR
jgi:mannose-6-phosphate isomerase